MPIFNFFNIISSPISGFYTGWLFPAAVVGLLVFLYGVLTMNSNTIAVETCQHGDQYLMCPLCETFELSIVTGFTKGHMRYWSPCRQVSTAIVFEFIVRTP